MESKDEQHFPSGPRKFNPLKLERKEEGKQRKEAQFQYSPLCNSNIHLLIQYIIVIKLKYYKNKNKNKSSFSYITVV